VVSVSLLLLSIVLGVLALNAWFPIRRRASLLFPSFGAAMVVSELPLHVLALGLFLGAGHVLVDPRVLEQPLGRVALALLLLASLALARLSMHGRSARTQLERALAEGLGISLDALCGEPRARSSISRRALAFWPFHAQVKRYADLRYAEGAGSRHLLDVYTLKQQMTGAPVVLQIHGGGWFTGDKRQQAIPLLLHLAQRGFVCVSTNYRLSPRATWPEHLIDVKLALKFVREHIAEYGGDPSCVLVTGGSAGGHLAAMLALTPNDPRYQPGFEHIDTSVSACIPLYGVYDLTDRLQSQASTGLLWLVSRFVFKQPFAKARELFDQASPMSLVGPHAPPFFVIQGAADNIVAVADAREFATCLRKTGCPLVVYAELPGAHHAFDLFHSPRTEELLWAIAFFAQHVASRASAQNVQEGSA
jgi:acetyl esterase/lipase